MGPSCGRAGLTYFRTATPSPLGHPCFSLGATPPSVSHHIVWPHLPVPGLTFVTFGPEPTFTTTMQWCSRNRYSGDTGGRGHCQLQKGQFFTPKNPQGVQLNQKETVGFRGMSVGYWYSRFPSEVSRQHPMPTSAREIIWPPSSCGDPPLCANRPLSSSRATSNLTPYPAYFLMKLGKQRGHPVPHLVLFVQK